MSFLLPNHSVKALKGMVYPGVTSVKATVADVHRGLSLLVFNGTSSTNGLYHEYEIYHVGPHTNTSHNNKTIY